VVLLESILGHVFFHAGVQQTESIQPGVRSPDELYGATLPILGHSPGVSGDWRAGLVCRAAADGPYSLAALKKVLQTCAAIRSVQVRTNSESGIPEPQQVSFYRDWIYRALKDAGRPVILDLRGWLMSPDMLGAAVDAGVPLRFSSKYWAEHLAQPYQPFETFETFSYLDFFKKPRPYQFYWEVWALGTDRVLLWGDPEYVRRAAPTFSLSGSQGFEIDAPLAQKSYGNSSERFDIFENNALYILRQAEVLDVGV
jgi:hypothetical protein